MMICLICVALFLAAFRKITVTMSSPDSVEYGSGPDIWQIDICNQEFAKQEARYGSPLTSTNPSEARRFEKQLELIRFYWLMDRRSLEQRHGTHLEGNEKLFGVEPSNEELKKIKSLWQSVSSRPFPETQ